MVEVDLLDFGKICKRLAKQALGKHAGAPAEERYARWVHVVIHCFRLKDEHSYRTTEHRLAYLGEIREGLELARDDIPDYTTIYKSFDRLGMWVWRALLRISAFTNLRFVRTQNRTRFWDAATLAVWSRRPRQYVL